MNPLHQTNDLFKSKCGNQIVQSSVCDRYRFSHRSYQSGGAASGERVRCGGDRAVCCEAVSATVEAVTQRERGGGRKGGRERGRDREGGRWNAAAVARASLSFSSLSLSLSLPLSLSLSFRPTDRPRFSSTDDVKSPDGSARHAATTERRQLFRNCLKNWLKAGPLAVLFMSYLPCKDLEMTKCPIYVLLLSQRPIIHCQGHNAALISL